MNRKLLTISLAVMAALASLTACFQNAGGAGSAEPAASAVETQARDAAPALPENYDCGVFSWRALPTGDDAAVLRRNRVTEIYQYIKADYDEEAVAAFLRLMAENGIGVYLLDGEPEWAHSGHYDDMAAVAERFRALNALAPDGAELRGIVFDVEPYLLDEWEQNNERLLRHYRRNLEKLKAETGIALYACIPYFYDTHGLGEQLRELVKATDGVLVMNYYRGGEIKHIETEAALAAEYQRKLVTIYELRRGGEADDRTSYHELGLAGVLDNYAALRAAYPGQEIGAAYHELSYLKELSARE